ncbi:hypothetical protein BH09SUM1_BH09SUM1_22280 [soil metagenome]
MLRKFWFLMILGVVGICSAEAHPANMVHVSDRIYSGAAPEDESDFEAIRKLGANTIVSVDGATPNVEAARALGMRYIHVPIEYSGITREQAASLSEAMEETTGTIYFHCHHGQHRGPAAAALAWRLSTDCSATSATEVLKQAKTGADYKGLWAAMDMANLAELRAEKPELVEVARVADLPAHMAMIDDAIDRLTACQKVGWSAPPHHPDIDPAQDALMIEEHYREIGRAEDATRKEDFKAWRAQAEKFSAMLKENLKAKDAAEADASFAALQQNCKMCHAAYRNNRE